jgi:hypothetical protein
MTKKQALLAFVGVALGSLSWLVLGVRAVPSAPPKAVEQKAAPQIHPAVMSAGPRGVSPVQITWPKEFLASQDYFAFVSKAAKPALEGDGYAALYISKALLPCLLMKTLYGKAADPQAALNQELAGMSDAWVADSKRHTFELCRGFFKGDAFASLPDRVGGYNSSRFWLDQAYHDNNPIAQSLHAGRALGTSGDVSNAQADINEAVASGDPEALFRVGTILSNGHGQDALQGFAWSIAACDLGYDCSAETNPDYFGSCVAAGTCNPGTRFQDIVVNAVGASGYANAYARAQEIETALSRGDTLSLQEFAQLR